MRTNRTPTLIAVLLAMTVAAMAPAAAARASSASKPFLWSASTAPAAEADVVVSGTFGDAAPESRAEVNPDWARMLAPRLAALVDRVLESDAGPRAALTEVLHDVVSKVAETPIRTRALLAFRLRYALMAHARLEAMRPAPRYRLDITHGRMNVAGSARETDGFALLGLLADAAGCDAEACLDRLILSAAVPASLS